MELIGIIKQIEETQTFGTNNFKVRNLLIETQSKYPQKIQIAFQQDRCSLLDEYSVDDEVKVFFDLRGREWKNKQGEVKYINTIVGWKIQHDQQEKTLKETQPDREVVDDLPF